ncbi:hypothetical protein [Pseudomonas luteola]|uniref:hypothetical protein n=1 Tax=Pseudomonas luteola TaxID=47886 RepID=UPI001239E37E|nr:MULTISPECIES: hypothetical protein [Pseudomonas]MBA1247623.1 hypothetical protein [Pseudomonas zeshuii]QEU29150.1 hypothetical protein FOB45_15835 [Pseudomonas luteola]
MFMKYLFILGARDPEMMLIETLVLRARHRLAYALADERRVYAGNAYKADRTSARQGEPHGPIVWVECGLADTSQPRDIVVDHHHEGDPGYDMPPARYWEGSSLGQVCQLLEIEPTPELQLAAAADHCLSAAYKGLCPGVDPAELRAWRIASRSNWQKINPDQLRATIEAAIEQVKALKPISIAGHEFFDAMDHDIPELSEASAMLGRPVMYSMPEPRSGRIKVGALNGSPDMLQAWMSCAREVLGLEDVYGNPIRGYAGGYLRGDILQRA